ncbi:MAG TPA: cytochrome c [Usitatibacter sp.]|nr:cytochrome c [Usitatibacter sp.]
MAENLRPALAGACLAAAIASTPLHAADTTRGSQTYAMHCAMCHGPAGQGIQPGAPKFNRGERMLQSDLVLLNSVRMGRGAMPGFMGVLRDRDILDVIAYIRTLQR